MEDVVYVLWIRHCQTCANVAYKKMNLTTGMFRQPLCTKKGVHQSYLFGEKLKIHETDILNCVPAGNTPLIEFEFHSSYLPRAVETTKLISAGYCKTDMEYNNNYWTPQINRMPFISEHARSYHKSTGPQNVISVQKSNCHVNALNKIIPVGLSVNTKHRYKTAMEETICKSTVKNGNIDKCIITNPGDNQTNFFEHILRQLKPGRLHIIVSHGKYIRKEVLAPLGCHHNKLHNLEGHIVRYTRNKSKNVVGKNKAEHRQYIPEYVGNKFVDMCNKAIADITTPDISSIGLDDKYMKYFECNYKFHNKSPILRMKRAASIEQYCNK